MRKLINHIVNPMNDKLVITVMDEPGPGGAHHHYRIVPLNQDGAVHIIFQNGPIDEVGVNGITHEALLAILIDRLESFQAGSYACEENRRALFALQEAMIQLHIRTKKRMDRDVEGTMKP